ncbi:GNAT family N-acetyltransferase [Virgibacillus sp. MSJ-26]|uniref:GNAT family N-acetyltransferase n=1 Tax=Virgibacillus sp. MSJ-26 TaxID=2841522 RepID=UPI001C10A830|nr:GNAT family N-acetyltransferase [Virgibacillus sp. MSJ-26]MBU5466148.1 GNAT family N-acetyltransferase [Virgibacillus sp. MSJ-26]
MLKTKRCMIDTIRKTDFNDVRNLYTNPEVRKYLGGIRGENSIKSAMGKMLKPPQNSFYWIVRERETGCFIGLVSLDPHHEGDYQEISYQFIPDYWGQGYATEVVGHIIDYSLSELALSKIVAETQTANTASCKLLEKLGMTLERIVYRFNAEQAIYSAENPSSEKNE